MISRILPSLDTQTSKQDSALYQEITADVGLGQTQHPHFGTASPSLVETVLLVAKGTGVLVAGASLRVHVLK